MKKLIFIFAFIFIFTTLSYASDPIISVDADITIDLVAQNTTHPNPTILIFKLTDKKTNKVIYITRFNQQIEEIGFDLNKCCYNKCYDRY